VLCCEASDAYARESRSCQLSFSSCSCLLSRDLSFNDFTVLDLVSATSRACRPCECPGTTWSHSPSGTAGLALEMPPGAKAFVLVARHPAWGPLVDSGTGSGACTLVWLWGHVEASWLLPRCFSASCHVAKLLCCWHWCGLTCASGTCREMVSRGDFPTVLTEVTALSVL